MKRKLALLTALLLLAGQLAGCKTVGAETPVPSEKAQITTEDICRSVTGLDADTAVVSGDGITVPLGLYCYWQVYNASLMEYRVYSYAESDRELKSLIGTNGYLNWDAPFDGYASLREYLNKQTDDTVRFYMALEAMAAENGLTLNEEDKAQLETERKQLVTSLGSEEAFDVYIAEMCLTRETYDRISAYPFLLDKLDALAKTEGSPLYIGDDELNAYGMCTDHIYLTKIDLSGYDDLSEDEIAAKKKTAEELVMQLAGAAEPAAAFAALADQYSEDPYRSSYPDGYVYSLGTMNAAYEAAAGALGTGEVSGVVEGETGFYIILRKDLIEELNANPEKRDALREEYLTDVIQERSEKMTVTTAVETDKLDVSVIYGKYVELMSKRAA